MVAPPPLAPIWAARVHEVQLPSSDPLAAPAAPPRPPMDPQHAPALEEPAPARLTHPPPRPLPVSHHPDPLQEGSSRSCCTRLQSKPGVQASVAPSCPARSSSGPPLDQPVAPDRQILHPCLSFCPSASRTPPRSTSSTCCRSSLPRPQKLIQVSFERYSSPLHVGNIKK